MANTGEFFERSFDVLILSVISWLAAYIIGRFTDKWRCYDCFAYVFILLGKIVFPKLITKSNKAVNFAAFSNSFAQPKMFLEFFYTP